MLVLRRKVGEKVLIGPDIVVMVTEISGNQVKLGIDAPDDVAVDRPNVRRSKEEEKHGTD